MADIISCTSTIIETPRLIIDEFQHGDLPRLTEIFANMKHAGQPWFNADADRPDSIAAMLNMCIANQSESPRQNYRLAVRLKLPDGDSKLIGYVAVTSVGSRKQGLPDTGVFIDPKHGADGYAREARVANSLFAFAVLGVDKLWCDIDPANTASIGNVTGMGYQRFERGGKPVEIRTKTMEGYKNWHRFMVTRATFYARMPELIARLANKCNGNCEAWTAAAQQVFMPPKNRLQPSPIAPVRLGPFSFQSACHLQAA